MSLDVSLVTGHETHRVERILVRQDGQVMEIDREEWDRLYPGQKPIVLPAEESSIVFGANITHNLTRMADEAGLYLYLWRPSEVQIVTASDLIAPLSAGLAKLENDPMYFRKFNPSNGWGSYDVLVSFVREYLAACEEYPQASVSVSR